MRTTLRLRWSAAAIVLLLLGACADAPVEEGSQHFHFSEEVRQIMQRLHNLVHERELTDQQVDELRARQVNQLIDNIDQLQSATTSLARTNMSAAEQSRFRDLTADLSLAATRVNEASRTGIPGELTISLSRLDDVCKRCHEVYR